MRSAFELFLETVEDAIAMSDPSAPTELVIVLQGADALAPGLVKSVVNSHIAKVTHARRRQAAEKRAQLVAKGREEGRGGARSAVSGGKGDVCERCGMNGRCSCASRLSVSTSKSKSQSLFLQRLVKGGNSDPFSTTTIVVDVTVSELLTFCRDFLLPCLHGKEVDNGQFSYADSFWHDTTTALQDECSGYAYLSRYAALIASITNQPSMSILAMKYKDRASVTLRKRLANRAHLPVSDESCWSIYSLFTAEIAAQNLVAARIHAQMLKRMIQPESRQTHTLDSRLLHAALWHDVQRSSLTLTRTTFDLDRWSDEFAPPTCLDSTWDGLATGGVVPKTFSFTVSSSIECRFLREAFSEVKYLLTIIGHLGYVPSLATDSTIAQISTRGLVLEGGLVNNYLDYMDIVDSGGLDEQQVVDFATVALASLAALYWVRRAAQHEGLGAGSKFSRAGSTVYTAGPLILSRMRDLMETVEALSYSPDCPFYLWMLYVSAMAEETVNGSGGWGMEGRDYHSRLFAMHARRMGLLVWPDVEQVLNEFLYVAAFSPTAQKNFEAAMMEELQSQTCA